MGVEINNLKELRDFLLTCDTDQLSKPAVVDKTERFQHTITSVYWLEEDYYKNDEGIDPVSSFEPVDEDDVIENYVIIPKGTVFLNCDNEEEDEKWRAETLRLQRIRDQNLIAQGKLIGAMRPKSAIDVILLKIIDFVINEMNLSDGESDYLVKPYLTWITYSKMVITIFTDAPALFDSCGQGEDHENLVDFVKKIPASDFVNARRIEHAFYRFGYTWLVKQNIYDE